MEEKPIALGICIPDPPHRDEKGNTGNRYGEASRLQIRITGLQNTSFHGRTLPRQNLPGCVNACDAHKENCCFRQGDALGKVNVWRLWYLQLVGLPEASQR